jgi:hypothetical protein
VDALNLSYLGNSKACKMTEMFAGQFEFSTWLYTTHVIQTAARIKKTELHLKPGTSFTENHENKKTDSFLYEF